MNGIPKRIIINKIKSAPKNTQQNPQLKPANHNQNIIILPSNNVNKNAQKKHSKKPQLINIQNEQEKFEVSKRMMKEYLLQLFQNIKPTISQSQYSYVFSLIKKLEDVQHFSPYLTEYFKAYNFCHNLLFRRQDETHQIINPAKYKQAKKLFFLEQNIIKQTSKSKRESNLRSQNEELKSQVFKLKQSVKQNQKKLLLLIEQFKQRKSIYLREIQKLSSIVQTSIEGLPNLIASKKEKEKNRPRINITNKLSIPQDLKLTKKQSEYNTIFYDYKNELKSDPNNLNLSKLHLSSNISPLHRYKSEERIKINK